MRKIEAIIETEELGDLRDALRELGVRTMRVTEVKGKDVLSRRREIGRQPDDRVKPFPRAKIGVVVPDDLTDRVILTLMGVTREGGVRDGEAFVSSIEQVVRLEAEGFFDGML
jgi:nitrogen regulatory protein PII